MTALLRIRDLRVRFPGTTAVQDVALDLHRDEVLAVVGESGSGKSVTALAVLGLLPGAEVTGSIVLDGRELVGLAEEELRTIRGKRVALVFQEPSTALNPVERVGWQIGEVLRAHGVKSRRDRAVRVGELLAQVGIPAGRARDYPHQFSGGQKQRIVLALALAADPDVLIADEPTTALDVTVQAEILALLRDLQRSRRLAVLLITHNMGVVADLADRVAVMRDGKVVETRDVEGLFAAPAAEYTRELLASVPRLDGPARPAPISSKSAEPVFAVTDLVVGYRGRPAALDQVTLTIGPGEVLGLVGESGSGKTTLGRAAVGRLRPTAGIVRLFGTDLAGLSRAELRALRKRIGVVHQDPAASLDPRRTVLESITEPLDVHGLGTPASRRARAEELLEQVALRRDHGSRLPRELSGGQRQRVSLARALALEPALLLADEPTSALDVSVQAAVLDLFSELQARHEFACLFISHDLAVVNQVADRVAVLRGGRLVELGTTRRVLTRPATPYTRTLLDSAPVPDPAAQRSRRPALQATA